MKQNKRNEQDNRTQNSSPYTPSAPYGSFMGDPRLAKMAEPKESPKKQRRSKITAKITTIVGALLALSVMVAVFVPMLRDHFASLPEDPVQPPITAPITPPVDPPVDLPIDPPSQPIDPPAAPEWEKAKLTFNPDHFKRRYKNTQSGPLMINYPHSQASFVGLTGLLDRWSDVLLQTFQYDGKFVTFRSSSLSKAQLLARFFMYDALCELRAEKGPGDSVTEHECLEIVAFAADQMSNFTYVFGNEAKIGDEYTNVFLGLYRSELPNFYEQSLRLQSCHTAMANTPDDINAAIDDYATSVARAMVLLLFGYTHPVFGTVTNEVELEYYQTYYSHLNQSLDAGQMQTYTEHIAAIVREQFAEYRTYTTENSYQPITCLDFVPFKMWQAVIDALPTMVEQTTGMTYPEFIKGGYMSPAWYMEQKLQGRYNSHSNYAVQGAAYQIDLKRLNALLAQLTFEASDIHLKKQCEISYAESIFPAFGEEERLYPNTNYTAISPDLLSFPLFTAGYTEVGDYYLQSSHYFAPLTEEQYKIFIEICTEGHLASEINDARADLWIQIISGKIS